MNVNEVISNRCCQIAGTPLEARHGSPNDHVNMAQSSNDHFLCDEHRAAVNVKQRLIHGKAACTNANRSESQGVDDVIKMGAPTLQDATPLTLGQSGGL